MGARFAPFLLAALVQVRGRPGRAAGRPGAPRRARGRRAARARRGGRRRVARPPSACPASPCAPQAAWAQSAAAPKPAVYVAANVVKKWESER
jgi:hypothetical protein